jgi:hypothetical protein
MAALTLPGVGRGQPLALLIKQLANSSLVVPPPVGLRLRVWRSRNCAAVRSQVRVQLSVHAGRDSW